MKHGGVLDVINLRYGREFYSKHVKQDWKVERMAENYVINKFLGGNASNMPAARMFRLWSTSEYPHGCKEMKSNSVRNESFVAQGINNLADFMGL